MIQIEDEDKPYVTQVASKPKTSQLAKRINFKDGTVRSNPESTTGLTGLNTKSNNSTRQQSAANIKLSKSTR